MADTFAIPKEQRPPTASFDRFIPNRSAMDFEFAHFKLTTPPPKRPSEICASNSPTSSNGVDDSGFWSPEPRDGDDELPEVGPGGNSHAQLEDYWMEENVESVRRNIEVKNKSEYVDPTP